MDSAMSRTMAASGMRVLQQLGLCAICGLSVSAIAQSLPDPTRPAASMLPPAVPVAASSRPILQSVLISPTRRLAIISGKQVMLGEKFGTATVIKINETSVVLRDGQAQLTVVLFDSAARAPQ